MRSALASLNRLSPSRITNSRWGGRSWRSTAVAAAASGGATTAPSATAAGHGHVRHQRSHRHGHGHDGDRHREERQRRHRAPVVSQVPDRGVEGRVQQNRRHEQDQGELGVQAHDRRAGHQGQTGTGQGQKRGIRRPDPPGQGSQRRADQEEDDDGLEDVQGHGSWSGPIPPARRALRHGSCHPAPKHYSLDR